MIALAQHFATFLHNCTDVSNRRRKKKRKEKKQRLVRIDDFSSHRCWEARVICGNRHRHKRRFVWRSRHSGFGVGEFCLRRSILMTEPCFGMKRSICSQILACDLMRGGGKSPSLLAGLSKLLESIPEPPKRSKLICVNQDQGIYFSNLKAWWAATPKLLRSQFGRQFFVMTLHHSMQLMNGMVLRKDGNRMTLRVARRREKACSKQPKQCCSMALSTR